MIEPNARTDWREAVWPFVLISLSTAIGFQVVRVFVTSLVYAFGERYGQTLAAAPALIVFLSPALALMLFGRFSPRKLLIITWGGLAIARLLMQISRDVNLNMVLAGGAIVLALLGLVGVFSWLNSVTTQQRRQSAQAIILGMALEAGLHGAFQTWDYVWQPGLIPLVTALMVSALALVALWQVR